jgi:hypothetical protein
MFDHEDHEERCRVDEEVQVQPPLVEPDPFAEEVEEQRDSGGDEDRLWTGDRGVDSLHDATSNVFQG